MKISVYDEVSGAAEFTVEELTSLAPLHLSLEDRVPGTEGKAFDVKAWFREFQQRQQARTDRVPDHMAVEAVDEFQAVIPWGQLDQAVFLYEQNGKPLQKGFPIRLYVPDGSSECLNVKSVVKIRFGYHGAADEATYGFKNQVSVEELKLKK
ncbi:MAG: hypothetical protein K0S39_1922 [Paenibacillus sp.]|jgi:hypothetical protein|nr:hypothetical protein [Paenibacillus sp.]